MASEMANDVGSVQDDGLDVEPRSGLRADTWESMTGFRDQDLTPKFAAFVPGVTRTAWLTSLTLGFLILKGG